MKKRPSFGKGAHASKRKPPRTALLSQDPSVQVPSAQARFTTVFGMGTGGTTPLWARGESHLIPHKNPNLSKPAGIQSGGVAITAFKRGSRPRTIRTGRLNRSPCLHPRPINPLVSRGPYQVNPVGGLISGWASRLDAFSGYPVRTWLPDVCPRKDSRETRGASTPVLSY